MKLFKRIWPAIPLVTLISIGSVHVFSRQVGGKSTTTDIIRGNIVEAAYAVGTVKSNHVFNIKTGVASRVLKRLVRIGDAVKEGDALLHLEGLPIYRAPFDGEVTALNYEVGELVFAQTVVLTMANRDSLYLELSLDERTIGSIQKGQTARISFEGFRGQPKKGVVRSIYSNDSTFYVLVDFDSQGLSLYPGMTSDVAIEIGVHKDKLLAPLGAVITSGHMTVLRDGPRDIKVKLGPNDGKYAIIEDGDLHEGDKVVLRREPVKEFP